jgi:phosphoglycolate phosphatase
MSYETRKSVIVTDLDNTLWDWFDAWYQSFSAMLARLTELSGVPQKDLERQIRQVHQLRGTTEYSRLLHEVPALIAAAAPASPAVAFAEAMQVLNARREAATRLYPGVRNALDELKKLGVTIVAYTESLAYWTEWRVIHTGLDGVIDVLYSAPDHDWPDGATADDVTVLTPSKYSLKQTRHQHVPSGVIKPNVEVLHSILDEQGFRPEQAVYVGDSLMKDVAMAQDAGVLDAHAEYGQVQKKTGYDLLRRVSHWPDEVVAREREIARSALIEPTITCQRSFAEVVPLFLRDRL